MDGAVENSVLLQQARQEGRIVPGTHHRSGEYSLIFAGLAPEDLVGRRVLNVGSGGTDIAGDMARYGINVDVTELDIRFDDQDFAARNPAKKKIAADILHMDELKAEVGKFDVVFSGMALSIMPYEDFVLALQNIASVLAGGGRAYVFPGVSELLLYPIQDKLNVNGTGIRVSSIHPEVKEQKLLEMAPRWMLGELESIVGSGNETLVLEKE